MYRPNFDMSRGVLGFPVKTKMKAYTKLTVAICCQIFAKSTVAPSSGDFRRRPTPPRQVTARAEAERAVNSTSRSNTRSSSMVTGKMPRKSFLAWSDRCSQKHGPVIC